METRKGQFLKVPSGFYVKLYTYAFEHTHITSPHIWTSKVTHTYIIHVDALRIIKTESSGRDPGFHSQQTTSFTI